MSHEELRELDAWIEANLFEGKKYGLKKRGYWYRPQAHGYTDRQSEAWRLDLEEAKQHEYKHGGYDERVFVMEIDTPYYTTHPDVAFEVLRKCGKETPIGINFGSTNEWWICDLDKKSRWATDKSLEICICLFAKKLFSK